MNLENKEALYRAFQSKDTRFDGKFFIGVSSTGIYCRPICRARLPKRENCTYFLTAAEAEQAGYRPCLLCRPELAPGYRTADSSLSFARRAAGLLEENCTSGQSLEVLAEKLGCTGRHLRRIFMQEYHVTPVQYLQTCRLLLAKSLLTDTKLPVLEIAMAAGFGSLRRFNDLFQKQYHLTPTALRKQAAAGRSPSGRITVGLGYRPPYQWERMLQFLEKRAIPGVERVEQGHYLRTVRMYDKNHTACCGWIRVGQDREKHLLTVTLSESLLPVLPKLLGRIRQQFDLSCTPDFIHEALQRMDDLYPGLNIPGIRLPGCFEPFEMAVRAVLGQWITVQAASTLAGRFAGTYGTPAADGIEGLERFFPEKEALLEQGNVEERLGTLGIPSAKSRAILALARAMKSGEINLSVYGDPMLQRKKLLGLKGIGPWTADYLVMRTMGWTDAFLETDAGIRHALPSFSPREMEQLSKSWSPWRSYAMMNLWSKEETGMRREM